MLRRGQATCTQAPTSSSCASFPVQPVGHVDLQQKKKIDGTRGRRRTGSVPGRISESRRVTQRRPLPSIRDFNLWLAGVSRRGKADQKITYIGTPANGYREPEDQEPEDTP